MAELKYCVQEEMVLHSVDFLERRTGRLYFDIDSVLKYYKKVNGELALIFGWDTELQQKDLNTMNAAIANALAFKGARKII